MSNNYDDLVAQRQREDDEFWATFGDHFVPTVSPVVEPKDDFLNDDFINAEIQRAATTPSVPDKAPKSVSEPTSDGPGYFLLNSAAKIPHEEAERMCFSLIRTALNKGWTSDEIYAYYVDKNVYFIKALSVKRPQKKFDEMIALSEGWDLQKNRVEIFQNALGNGCAALKNGKLRKETKTLAPLHFVIAAVMSARDCNRKALLSLRFTQRFGLAITTEDLDVPLQRRRWEAYAKQGYINFEKGKAGGSSNKVEILETANVTTDQKKGLVAYLKPFFVEGEFKDALFEVLDYVAAEPFLRYNDELLQKLIGRMLELLDTIVAPIIHDRKAERLVESKEFADSKAEERAIATARVNEYMKSGGLFAPKIRKQESAVAVMEPEVVVEALQIHVEASEELITTEPSLPEYPALNQFKSYDEYRVALKDYSDKKAIYDFNHLADGIDF